MLYKVKFLDGLDLVNAVLTPPVPALDGYWYFSVFGKRAGSPDAKAYCYRWSQVTPFAEPLTLEQYTNARGTLAVGGLGKRLWQWSFEDKEIIVQLVPDWEPPTWMVTNYEARLAALEAKVRELEARPSGGGLSARYTQALEKLCALLGL